MEHKSEKHMMPTQHKQMEKQMTNMAHKMLKGMPNGKKKR